MNIDEQGWKIISDKLEPQEYKKSRTIIKEKESLKMIFIVDGFRSIEKSFSLTRWELKAGAFYGEELLHRPSAQATESVKAKTDVQALILEAEAWKSVVSELKLHISREVAPDSSKYEISLLSMLKNVPELEKYEEKFLKAISEVIRRERYDVIGSPIIKENDKLNKMFWVTRGKVGVTRPGKKNRKLYKFGALYGEELMPWALDVFNTGTASSLPSSAGTASPDTKVDVLIIYATDLEKKMKDLAAIESPPQTDSESED